MSWVLLVLFISLGTNSVLAEGSHHHRGKKQLSAVVVGTVYCNTCFQDDFSKSNHFISGASVAVECRDEKSNPSFRQEVKTDEHGEFRVKLPFSVSKHVKRIKRCSVQLLSSSEPYCAVASSATSSAIHLKSRKQGTHIFSAGFFTFKPEKQPEICSQKPIGFRESKMDLADPSFPPPLQDPMPDPSPLPGLPNLPPLPSLPLLPPLPPLPGLPSLPLVPPMPLKAKSAKKEASLRNKKQSLPNKKPASLPDKKPEAKPDFFLPPNPLQPPLLPPNPLLPPPSLLPPNPLIPPPSLLPPNPLIPPPSVLPPNPFQPTPAPFIPPLPSIPTLPPVPGLTPPSPPPPSFPFPFPPLPFPPSPGFPGIPPASSSTEKSTP